MKSQVTRSSESGFSLLGVIIFAAVGGIALYASSSVLKNQRDYMKIIRMKNQMEIIEKRVINAASNIGSLEVTMKRSKGATNLKSCLVEKECKSSSVKQSIDLYNVGGIKLSGDLSLAGKPCTGDCPLTVTTSYRIRCAIGVSTCTVAEEIETTYQISQKSLTFFEGRTFPPIEGTVSLSSFSCENGQYVVGIDSEGKLICDSPIGSWESRQCKAGTAAFGLTAEGRLICQSIMNFCSKSLAIVPIIDVSGSMKKEKKIDAAKDAAGKLVSNLGKDDQVSVVKFNQISSILDSLTLKHSDAVKSIDGLSAGGRTNIAAGLVNAQQTLASYTGTGNKVIVLVSDGFHNTGSESPLARAALIKADGTRIFTIGFGKSPDISTLKQIASSPSDFRRAENAGEIEKVFEELTKTVTCKP